MMVCITLFDNLESPRAVVNSSVSETKAGVETSSVNRRVIIIIIIIKTICIVP